jgi:hypothetical protein
MGSELRLPDFVVIGAQKAGTTSLHAALAQHPQVFLPTTKELHYFSSGFDQPLASYGAHFGPAKAEQVCGEATPYYLFHPAAPQRLAACLPKARLIVLLRDPVARSLSHYFHAIRRGNETLPLEAALAAEPERLAGAEAVLQLPGGAHRAHQTQSYLARSRYDQQLPRFAAWQQAGRLLILRSEDLFNQATATLARVLAFLGLPESDAHHLNLPRQNSGEGEATAVSAWQRQSLRQQLDPTYTWATSTLGMHWDG